MVGISLGSQQTRPGHNPDSRKRRILESRTSSDKDRTKRIRRGQTIRGSDGHGQTL